MAAKYSRLPTADPGDSDTVAFDFSSCNTYGGRNFNTEKYKSIFVYGDSKSPMSSGDLSLSVVKQSFTSRLCELIITVLCATLCVLTFPVSAIFTIKIVSDSERLVIFRLGRLQGVRNPGVNFVIPCVDRIKRVDVRIKAFNVPPFQLLTSDAGIIELGADVYYKVSDAIKSVTAVQDLNTSLRGLVRNSLMNSLTKLDLQDIEVKQAEIVNNLQTSCNLTASSWGAEIHKIQLSPIKVLQAANQDASIPGLGGLGGNEGLTQVFQQLAQAFITQGNDGKPTVTTGTSEASGAAVGCEDVELESRVTPAGLVELVRGVLCESLVRSVGAVYQFELTGNNGGTFYLDLKRGAGRVGVGPDPNHDPDVTLQLSVSDMQKMFAGHLKPLSAYMSGRLKVQGDLSAATRLDEVMERVVNKSSNTSSTTAAHTVVNI